MYLKNRYKFLSCVCALMAFLLGLSGCGKSNKEAKDDHPTPKPLNLCIFVDLSDRIEKSRGGMIQLDKDQIIINGLEKAFIDKQSKIGFQKSEDCFEIVFYPPHTGAQNIADKLTLNLKAVQGPKKRAILDFKKEFEQNLAELYKGAQAQHDYFGSDIFGFFQKDKVADLCKEGYRNILVIFSDGYIFDVNNKQKEGSNYSYILPQTLAVEGSGLIPCKISNSDMEIYFVECNPVPQTDYAKMKHILEEWFKQMGIEKVDIQDTDLPQNVLKHLLKNIF